MRVALGRIRLLFLCATVLSVVFQPTASGRQSEEQLPFETIVNYTLAGPFEPGTPVIYVVADRHEWKKVWKLAHVIFPSRPPLPEIDFSNRMVLAVFHGYTGGQCATSITNIVKTVDGLKIHARQTCPGATCGAQPANALKPVEIVEIERVDKGTRKKDPDLILNIEFIECKAQD